jgi:hypothetical protein
MRVSLILAVLVALSLFPACSSSPAPSPSDRGGGEDPGGGAANFTPAERATMDTAWRAFKNNSPDWPGHRARWIALGPKASDSLVENLFRVMVISSARNAPEWYDKARMDLMHLGALSVPVLSGIVAQGKVNLESGEEMPLPTGIVTDVVDILAVVGPPAVPSLAGLTEDGKADVRRAAAVGLGKIGDPAGLAPLRKMLRGSGDWADRLAAARALGLLGGPEAEDELIRALDDSDPAVVQEAARSLARLKSTRAIASLEAHRAKAQAANDYAVASVLGSAIKAIRGGR